jgi:hypothetical protein
LHVMGVSKQEVATLIKHRTSRALLSRLLRSTLPLPPLLFAVGEGRGENTLKNFTQCALEPTWEREAPDELSPTGSRGRSRSQPQEAAQVHGQGF